jgi:hypothetical protein
MRGSRTIPPLAAAVAALATGLLVGPLPGAERKKVQEMVQEIAGSSEFLREVPKHFATLVSADPSRHQVTLKIEGQAKEKTWPLTPDAEIKVAGWWGRLGHFTAGDRVWAWFKTNRKGQPVAIFMLADELSEQDMHGPGLVIDALTPRLTLKPVRGKSRSLQTGKAEIYRKDLEPQSGRALPSVFKVGAKVYAQSAGEQVRLVYDAKAFDARRNQQKAAVRKEWLARGLPGTVTFLHLSGEMDFMLDHEAMRWGRSLKPGDQVSLLAETPIPAVVKTVRAWRERTQLRLVAKGADLADLIVGQRLGLKMKAPPASVQNAQLPPDLGRLTDKKERVEWFLASIYCTCPVQGNVCTGQFYTLASCNPNACGTPNLFRKAIAEKIDKGLSDKQIFEDLLKDDGPILLRPHLLP